MSFPASLITFHFTAWDRCAAAHHISHFQLSFSFLKVNRRIDEKVELLVRYPCCAGDDYGAVEE